VPFEFDIHAVIETDNAPALEYKLHKVFLGARVNKINLRKEFFRLSLSDIRQVVEKLKQGEDYDGNVIWTEKARAAQFYDTRDIDINSPAKEKWLKLQTAKIERRLRQVEREPLQAASILETEGNGDGQES
jgi:hypothetical protein